MPLHLEINLATVGIFASTAIMSVVIWRARRLRVVTIMAVLIPLLFGALGYALARSQLTQLVSDAGGHATPAVVAWEMEKARSMLVWGAGGSIILMLQAALALFLRRRSV